MDGEPVTSFVPSFCQPSTLLQLVHSDILSRPVPAFGGAQYIVIDDHSQIL